MKEVFFILIVLFMLFGVFMVIKISIEIYFIDFKLENHPKLIVMLDDLVNKICADENIKVFHKTYVEMNDGRKKEDESVGRYVYTLNHEYQKKMTALLNEFEQIEKDYGLPMATICTVIGHDTPINKEELTLPRILLCDTRLKELGISSYYNTFLHEIGHHFAIKENKTSNHTEIEADKHAYEIIKKELPLYFRLFFDFNFRYENNLKVNELSGMEKLKAYFQYFKYLIKNKRINLFNINK